MSLETLVTDPRIRSEIEALITEHAWMIDHHSCERLADLYIEDGKMTGAGHETIGRAAIEAFGQNRAKMSHRQARHVLSNLRLVADGPRRIQGGCVVTLYRHDGVGKGLPEPVAIADLNDTYELCADGRWRIKERRIDPIFESPVLKTQLPPAAKHA